MTEGSEPLTLEEIGRLAGVSRSTVSRVLNDLPDVSATVRERVEAVIETTGFHRNQAARALVSKHTGVIGLVVNTDVDELFGDPYYSALVHGIQEGCADTDTTLSIFPVYGELASSQVLAALAGQGFVDGVIVTAGPRSEALIGTLRDRAKALVVVGHPIDAAGTRRVDVDSVSGSRAAVEHLIGLGRRRIAFVGPGDQFLFAAERLQGYRQALDAARVPFDPDLVVRVDGPSDVGDVAAVTLLERDVDAIHVATDTMAVGMLRALRELGVNVPGRVAVVGFDGLPGAAKTEPELSTVVQPVHDVGRTAVAMLVGRDDRDVVILPTTLRTAPSSAVS